MGPKEAKIIPENITIFHLDLVRYEIKEVAKPTKEGFSLEISHKVSHNLKEERLKVSLSILLKDEIGNESISDLDFHFQVKDLQSFYSTDEDGTPFFKSSFISVLLGISFSTARGILYERFSNTIFNRVILPVISPQLLLEPSSGKTGE